MPPDATPLCLPVEDIHTLTPLQRGMLFNAVEYGGDVFVEQIAWTLSGPLETSRLSKAWAKAVARHGAMRSLIRWEGLTQPYQIVHAAFPPVIEIRDTEPTSWAELEAAERQALPDMQQSPPSRLLIVALGDNRWRLVWTVHHIILDGWSAGLFLQDVAAFYADRERQVGSAPQFSTFTAWTARRSAEYGTLDQRYWQNRFRHLPEPSRLVINDTIALSPDRAAQDHLEITLSHNESDQLRKAAARHGVTLAVLLQGAMAVLLSRYTGRRDVSFGTVASIRPPEIPGITDMVGMFVSTLPAIHHVPHDKTLADWLKSVGQLDAEGREHGMVPLSVLARAAGTEQADTLFDVLLVVENMPGRSNDGAPSLFCDCRVSDEHVVQNVRQPLSVIVYPAPEIVLRLAFQPSRFIRNAVARLGTHFRAVLAGMASAQTTVPDAIDMLLPEEMAILTHSPATSLPLRTPSDLVTDFSRSHQAAPHAVAVIDGSGAWTYDELDAESTLYHHALAQRGVAQGDVIGIFLQKGRPMLAAILGVLKAGAAYVPLDITYPPQRLAVMIATARCCFVLTDGAAESGLLTLARQQVLLLSGLRAQGLTGPAPAVTAAPAPDSDAYAVFTSGSTGTPKGMLLTHRGISEACTVVAEHLGLTPASRVLALASPCFDISVAELFMALTVGASVVLLPREETRPGEALQSVIATYAITGAIITPSVLRTITPKAVPTLQSLLAGGEVLPPDLAMAWRDIAHFMNAYGPAEGCIFATSARNALGVPLDTIGTAREGCRTYVLDAEGRPLPTGVPGEICLASSGLTTGYLGNPELTAERFLDNPFWAVGQPGEWRRLYRTGDLGWLDHDGWLHFSGRKDTQVKVDGVRIELEEIEAVLRSMPDIGDAAVVATRWQPASVPPGKTVVGAFLMSSDGPLPAESEIRGRLLEALPAAAIPSVIQPVTAMPMGGTGKLDRGKLKEMLEAALVTNGSRAFEPPVSMTEHRLAAVWREVLELHSIGRHDHFFRLGGDSIKALQTVSKLRKDIPGIRADDLFRHPELHALAQLLDNRTAKTETPAAAVPDHPPPAKQAARSLSHGQECIALLVADMGDGPIWHTTAGMILSGELDVTRLRTACESVVARHPALHMGCQTKESGPVGLYAPDSPLDFRYQDLRQAGGETAADYLAAAAFAEPLPLDRPPLLRILCLRLSDAEWAWTIIFHRFIADPGTRTLVFREIGEVYRRLFTGQSILLPSVPSFAEAIAEESTTPPAALADRWNQLFGQHRKRLPPYATDRSARRRLVSLPAALATSLRATQGCGQTEYAVLTAAAAQTILDWSGEDTLTIATPLERRTEATQAMAGPLSDEIHLTLTAIELADPAAAVQRVASLRTAAIDLAAVPLVRHLQLHDPEALARPDVGASVVISSLTSDANHASEDGLLRMRQWSYPRYTSPHDAVLVFWRHGDALSLMLEHRLGYLPEDQTDGFLTRLQTTLHHFCDVLSAQPSSFSRTVPA